MGIITLFAIFVSLLFLSGNHSLLVQKDQQQRRNLGRSVALGETFLWKNGIVPFEISGELPETDKITLFGAMRHIGGRSCVRFIPKEGQQDFVMFTPAENECKSSIGKLGGKQVVQIGSACAGVGRFLYHLMRTLGFLNEHCRHDRDLYIRVLEDNVVNEKLSEFTKRTPSEDHLLGVPYDVESVLHFDSFHHSKNEEEELMTLEPLHFHTPLAFSGGKSLSRGDIQKINRMYCPGNAGVKIFHATSNPPMCLRLAAGDDMESEINLVHQHWFSGSTIWTANLENAWNQDVGSKLIPRRQRAIIRHDNGTNSDLETVFVLGDVDDSLDIYAESSDDKSQVWFFKSVDDVDTSIHKDVRYTLDLKCQIINLRTNNCLQKDKNNGVEAKPCVAPGRKAAKAQQWTISYSDFYIFNY